MLVFVQFTPAAPAVCLLCDRPTPDVDRHAWEVHSVFPTAVLVVTAGNR